MIEGIDVHAKKFSNIYNKISSIQHDPLDHRKADFDKDYDEFKKTIEEAQIQLGEFFSTAISKENDIINALYLLKRFLFLSVLIFFSQKIVLIIWGNNFRFEKLNIKELKITETYFKLVPVYQTKLEEIRDRYNEDRADPPLPHKVPPIAGRIAWIRQLYKRIQVPMDIFKTREEVISHEKAQKCIKMYNSLSSVFVHYEMIYHKAWYDNAEVVSWFPLVV